MLRLSELKLVESKEELRVIPEGKVLINTINAHSYNLAQKDEEFAEALKVNGNQNEDETQTQTENDNQNDNLERKYLLPMRMKSRSLL